MPWLHRELLHQRPPHCSFLAALCLVLVASVVTRTSAAGGTSGFGDGTIDAFNTWFADPRHNHKVLRVAAADVSSLPSSTHGEAAASVRLGLRALSNIQNGEVYLHANASLSMSVRTWLLGRWPERHVDEDAKREEKEACAALSRMRMQLRMATLDWIEGHHRNEQALAADVRTLRALALTNNPYRRKWTTFENVASDEKRAGDGDGGDDRAAAVAVTNILRVLNTDEEDALLALWLVFEYIVAKEYSFYAPYLAILPSTVKELSSILFAQDDKVASLEGTAVYDRIGTYRKKLVLIHTRLNQTFFSKFTLFTVVPTATDNHYLSAAALAARCGQQRGDGIGDRPCFPRGLAAFLPFQWAMGVLWSRQVWWEGEAHLAPMHDLANCREPPPPQTREGSGGGSPPLLPVHRTELDRNAAENGDGEFVRTRATSSAVRGEELFENYGESNSFYMLFHGFALAHNSRDCGVLTMPADPRQLSTLLPPSTRLRLREGGMLRDAPCVRPDNIRFVVTEATGNGAQVADEEIVVSASLNEFLTTLRAGYILTQAPQDSLRRLLAHSLRELRQLADFCSASWIACSYASSQHLPPLRVNASELRSGPHDHDSDLDRVLQRANGVVLKAATAMVGDQLKVVARQVKRLAQRRERSSWNGNNDESGSPGTSWAMVEAYVTQQHAFLGYANHSLRQLHALMKRSSHRSEQQRSDDSDEL